MFISLFMLFMQDSKSVTQIFVGREIPIDKLFFFIEGSFSVVMSCCENVFGRLRN